MHVGLETTETSNKDSIAPLTHLYTDDVLAIDLYEIGGALRQLQSSTARIKWYGEGHQARPERLTEAMQCCPP